jgi:hypothetical protein
MFLSSRRALRKKTSRISSRSCNQSRRKFESLEDRRLLTTFNVNTTIDRVIDTSLTTLATPFGNGGKLTLREAVYLADLNSSLPSTINLKANSTYKLTVAGAGENNDFTGDLDIFWNLTIKKTDSGADPIINGNGLDRVFDMTNDAIVVTLDHLFITGGIARDSGRGGGGIGGTIDDTLILNNTTIKGNIATSPGDGLGGGIELDDGSSISITNSHVDGNSAAAGTQGSGGGIYLNGATGTGAVTINNSTVNGNSAYLNGGGIFDGSTGNFTVIKSQINNNRAGNEGGGASIAASTYTITNSTFNGNTVNGLGLGGGLYVSGFMPSINILKSNFSNNTASVDGGAVWCNDASFVISGSTFQNNSSSGIEGGGAIWGTAAVQVTDSVFSHNVAQGPGGAIEQDLPGDITILRSTFSQNVSFSDSTDQGGGAIAANGPGNTISVTDSKFTYNSAIASGGAIYAGEDQVHVLRSTFDHNTSVTDAGGALDDGDIEVTDSVFTYNTSKADGGALDSEAFNIIVVRSVFNGNTATNGMGGSFTDGQPPSSSQDTLSVTGSTISGNTAGGDGGGFEFGGANITMSGSTFSGNRSGSEGGGAQFGSTGSAQITNCTFSGNGAAVDGGGFDYQGDADLTIINATIAFNTSFNGGGIAQTDGTGTIHIGNTIVAKNIATNGTDIYDTQNAFDDLGHNLFFSLLGQGTAGIQLGAPFLNGSNDLIGVAPLLGALANNGGPTKTHALLAGSPAINAGDDTLAPSTDERGVKRPQGPHVDIGAYEKK